ncbi:MAG: low molecular weight protein arginine phosphatase [Clostridia bacterium]|nr:low molecular weight protein arginine phosphatase [Clostridia bacterium]
MNKKLIIFVCTGNTCRSPMAEALFKAGLSEDERLKIEVKSYGLLAFGGDSASENAIEVMREQNIDISAHRSTPLSQFAVDNADLIVTMTDSHTNALLSVGVPNEKIITLNVPDPFGGSLDDYRHCADEIKSKLEDVYAYIRKS